MAVRPPANPPVHPPSLSRLISRVQQIKHRLSVSDTWCPASPRVDVNKRYDLSSWRYSNKKGSWYQGDIRVSCKTKTDYD